MKKVLVVDGCKSERALVVEALCELTNVIVQGAVSDLGIALRALDESAPDVVVTDVRLRDGDGVQLIEAARRHPRSPAIVVYANSDSPAQRQRCMAAGADVYLPRSAGIAALQRGVLEVRPGRLRPVQVDRYGLLGRIAAGVAHDLNNYLSVVEVSLAILQRRAQDSGLRAELLTVRRAMESATQLTSSLIHYARGERPTPVRVSLGDLVRRTLDLVKRMIPVEIVIHAEIDDDAAPVLGVEHELEQLVLNLVLNARDAMPRGGELWVIVRASTPVTVQLEVADSGAGLPAGVLGGDLALAPSTKPGRNGGGLGLGVIRSVAERHGAVVRIGNRDGGGARIVIELPATDRGD